MCHHNSAHVQWTEVAECHPHLIPFTTGIPVPKITTKTSHVDMVTDIGINSRCLQLCYLANRHVITTYLEYCSLCCAYIHVCVRARVCVCVCVRACVCTHMCVGDVGVHVGVCMCMRLGCTYLYIQYATINAPTHPSCMCPCILSHPRSAPRG